MASRSNMLGQSFVEAHRRIWNSPERRLLILKWILCAGLLIEFCLSPKLWFGARSFPMVPVFGGLPEWPSEPFFVLLVLSVFATAILPNRKVAFTVVATGAAMVCFDITRLQPWFYLALLIFLALSSKKAWAVCSFFVVATYVWSGLQKLNLAFGEGVFSWLIQPFGMDFLKPFWFLAPIVEVVIGILLIFPKTRKWGLAGAVLMHGFLLLALGPFGHRYNVVIWPWNIWMPGLAFALLFRSSESLFPNVWRTSLGKGLVVLVGILPALSFFGKWDAYLSASLYSGKAPYAFIVLTESGVSKLPANVKPFLARTKEHAGLEVSNWALDELGVPPYPAERVYRSIAESLVEAGVPKEDMKLILTEYPSLTSSKPTYKTIPLP